MAMSLAALQLVASLAVRGTFCGRWVVVDRARCLAEYEGRRNRQSVRRGSLRRETLFGRPEAAAMSRPAVPEPKGLYTAAPEICPLYRH
jgi:hypothetical protein